MPGYDVRSSPIKEAVRLFTTVSLSISISLHSKTCAIDTVFSTMRRDRCQTCWTALMLDDLCEWRCAEMGNDDEPFSLHEWGVGTEQIALYVSCDLRCLTTIPTPVQSKLLTRNSINDEPRLSNRISKDKCTSHAHTQALTHMVDHCWGRTHKYIYKYISEGNPLASCQRPCC
jgi:hypothetical protein